MQRHPVYTVLVLCLAAASTASAQYTGPGARAPAAPVVARTVEDVLQRGHDYQAVELTGQLIRQIGRELFVFRDATGEITVELDAEDLPAGQPVTAERTVHLRGEVETRLLRQPRIEVEELRLASTDAR